LTRCRCTHAAVKLRSIRSRTIPGFRGGDTDQRQIRRRNESSGRSTPGTISPALAEKVAISNLAGAGLRSNRPTILEAAMRTAIGTAFIVCGLVASAGAQQTPPAAIPVGVVKAEHRPIEKTLDFVGRVDAVNRVEIRRA
jgi:hypothetical protein